MQPITRRQALVTLGAGIAAAPLLAGVEVTPIPQGNLVVLVTDPLARALSCVCVEGYGQRDYNGFGKYLEAKAGKPVTIVYAESLAIGLKKTDGRADMVIGKDSVMRADAASAKLNLTRVASLTGKDGVTTQTGLVVVASEDPALMADNLKEYRIFFGPVEAEESHAMALALLKDLEVPVPAKPETCKADEAALRVLSLQKQGVKAAAVIPSYSPPLLEGCGTIKKNALRVVGKTDPVPFIAAFATDRVSAADRATITTALMKLSENRELCTAMESKSGFVEPPAASANARASAEKK